MLSTDSPDDRLAKVVSTQFVNRPTLRSISAALLADGIKEAFPTLDFSVVSTKLASPNTLGGWDLRLLINVALEHIGGGASPDFSPVGGWEYFLTNRAPRRLRPTGANAPVLDMRLIERAIREIATLLPVSFQQALIDYWEHSTDAGTTRWQWLGDLLRSGLVGSWAALPATQQAQGELLKQVTDYPDRLDRASVFGHDAAKVYVIETTLGEGAQSFSLLSPEILVVNGSLTLMCDLSGKVDAFTSQDEFEQHWAQKIDREYLADRATWKRYEPNGNVFEIQAATLLNQQLADLASLKLPFNRGTDELEKYCARATDPAPWFVGAAVDSPSVPEPMRTRLPDWLKTASASERLAYRKHLLSLAGATSQARGRSFLDGIPDIRTFAANALHAQMLVDQPTAPGYDADELELTFAVAAGYPGGAGFVEHITLSLTDLALKNLAGKPKGSMTIRHKGGQLIQAWTTPAYLTDLVTRVNIGLAYPEHLKSLLLGDTAESRQRQPLFAEQLKAQLPLQALEWSINQVAGLTFPGYRCVAALMQSSRSERVVDGHLVVIRCLALLRKPGAQPDVVANMFVIEPQDAAFGPHVLYRPLYAQSLQQYPTREALLSAIAQPGALQDSVLTWLDEAARPVYANGGFYEPHIIRFGAGSEFDVLARPMPATLAVDEGSGELLQTQINGQLAHYLFGAHARALVDLADRQSISNAESRWAVLLEGGGLLLNTLLLPLLHGSAMSIAWLVMMTQSLVHDIPALQSNDPRTRETAWVDLLMNLSVLLLHVVQSPETSSPTGPSIAPRDSTMSLASSGLPGTVRHAKAQLSPGTVALPDVLIAEGRTAFDFAFSNPLNQLSNSQRAHVASFKIARPGQLPAPIETGARKGLYRINDRLHALIGDDVYPVAADLEGVFIIDPDDKSRLGPALKVDGNGRWVMDLAPKLRGGMPGARKTAQQRRNRDLQRAMQAEQDRLEVETERLVQPMTAKLNEFRTARDTYNASRTKLRNWWELLAGTNDEQKTAFLKARHEQEQAVCSAAKLALRQALLEFEQQARILITARRALISAIKPAEKALDTSEFERERSHEYEAISAAQLLIHDLHLGLAMESQFSERGETIAQIIARLDQHTPASTPDAYQAMVSRLEEMAELEDLILQDTYALEATLDEQAQDSTHGLGASKAFIKALPTQEMADPFNVILNTLDILRELSLDRTRVTTPEGWYFSRLLREQSLRSASTSHIALRTYSHFTTAERKAVLNTLVRQYETLTRTSRNMQELGLNREPYHERFLERLGQAQRSAEEDLAAIIREEQGVALAMSPGKRREQRPSQKRVFRTRNRGTLVGELRASEGGESPAIMDVEDPFTRQTVASFVEHPNEGVWNELVAPGRAKPTPAPIPRSLASLTTTARQLVEQRAGIESSIRFQMKKLQDPLRREQVDPLDWNDMLAQHADKLAGIATELEQAHGSKAQVPALVAGYRQEVADMTASARRFCSQGYKAQRPTQDHIDYLWIHQAVDINLVHRRQPTAAGDYVAEYVIREKNKVDALWYAHFHYTEIDSPATAYRVGHLKLAQQRYLLQKDLVREAGANDSEVVRVIYAPITAPLDEKLFLRL